MEMVRMLTFDEAGGSLNLRIGENGEGWKGRRVD